MPANGGPRRKPDYTAEKLIQIDQVLGEVVSTIKTATALIATLSHEVTELKKKLLVLEKRVPKQQPVFVDETP